MAITEALDGAGVPHAFGGALALAYHAEPRATVDIDVNIFVPPDDVDVVTEPLRALGVDMSEDVVALIEQDGQARAMWEGTFVDLFFAYDPFHEAAARAVERVPFGEATIPILSASHLVVCKAVFDRPKDWVDIESIIELDTPVDVAEVLRWVGRLAGDDDRRYERIAAVLSR